MTGHELGPSITHTSPLLYVIGTGIIIPFRIAKQANAMPPPDIDYLSPQNLEKLRLTGAAPPPFSSRPRPSSIRGQFLRGPIPLAWLARAAKLPGKSPLAVALAIRFEEGRLEAGRPIKLTNPLVAKFGVSRKSKYRAIDALEQAGLIEVSRSPRKAPSVRVIESGVATRTTNEIT